MPKHSSPRPRARVAALLMPLLLGLQIAQAQPSRTPRQLIDHLGVEVRDILAAPKPQRTPADAERAVAGQITEWIASAPGHPSLTEIDPLGRTPLMLAASSGYAQIVQALLADPAVRRTINQVNGDGDSAWMLAGYAPSMTLVACQPGMLTTERYPLLPPYLRRMAYLIKTKGAAIDAILDELQAAGAEARPDDAKRAWLAHCPDATPETREALSQGELPSALIGEAIASQARFNRAAKDDPSSLPAHPPAGMKFVADQRDRGANLPPERLQNGGMWCMEMPKPEMPPNVPWRGELSVRAVAFTRAGVVESADFEVLSGTHEARAVDAVRSILVRALAGYKCEGEHVFEQLFHFHVR